MTARQPRAGPRDRPEVIGFAAAYILAAGAIIGLLTAYSAAVLRSWRRGGYIAALLAALAGVIYLTRGLDWSGLRRED